MKSLLNSFLYILCFIAIPLFGLSKNLREKKEDVVKEDTIKLTINNTNTFTAKLENNPSAKALKKLLENGGISIEMKDYAGMKKVGLLGEHLPRNDLPTITSPGDLILYQGKYFVVYYASNSWNFTRLGKIENANAKELKSALGEGDAIITISKNLEDNRNYEN